MARKGSAALMRLPHRMSRATEDLPGQRQKRMTTTAFVDKSSKQTTTAGGQGHMGAHKNNAAPGQLLQKEGMGDRGPIGPTHKV